MKDNRYTSQWIVASHSPRSGWNVSFFDQYEHANRHAVRVNLDLGKDVFVSEIKNKAYGDRSNKDVWPSPI